MASMKQHGKHTGQSISDALSIVRLLGIVVSQQQAYAKSISLCIIKLPTVSEVGLWWSFLSPYQFSFQSSFNLMTFSIEVIRKRHNVNSYYLTAQTDSKQFFNSFFINEILITKNTFQFYQ